MPGLITQRRDFIKVIAGSAAARPLAARAQQPERMRRIGVLSSASESDSRSKPYYAAFQQELQELGWFDGRNYRIDYRFGAGDPDRIRAYAAELVRMSPDVIFTASAATVMALRQETSTIPIVYVLVPDPVANGIAESLARPGGNSTGFATNTLTMGSKWLELLKEMAPRVARVALVFNPKTAFYAGYLPSLEAAAPSFAIEVVAAPVHDAAEIEGAISARSGEPGSGLIVLPDAFTSFHHKLIVELAALHRLPVVYPYDYFARSGGLMRYGVESVDLFRRATTYVDRILRGAKPDDLPIQEPTRYELVINLKTAKALGLTIPPSLLARADQVTE